MTEPTESTRRLARTPGPIAVLAKSASATAPAPTWATALALAWASLLGLATVSLLPACNLFRPPITYEYKAQYRDLDNRTVAVISRTDDGRFYRFEGVGDRVAGRIAGLIAIEVPGVVVTDPDDVVQFKRRNPHWTTWTYRELVEALGVERVVIVELHEYRLHEPGNAHLWKGVASGRVSVLAAEAPDPDKPVFAKDISVRFPENEEIGLVNADPLVMEAGMANAFTRDAAGLFHDYEIVREQY